MSKFILFKRDDVDPYFRRVLEQSDVPEVFRSRVEVDSEKIVIDHKRVFKKGTFLHFSPARIEIGNPFSDGYLYTPLGFVPMRKTFPVVYIDGVLSTFKQDGHTVIREALTISDPVFDDLCLFDHVTRKVVNFRDYYKEKLQC